jgi:subtilisin family serine protease
MLHKRFNACRAASAIAALLALGPGVASAAPAAKVVTLITGDHVTVDGAGHAIVRPAPGRAAIQFKTVRAQGHTHVIPSDAVGPLRAGLLDPRLFDVTELVASGYDKRSTTPVIVTGIDAAGAKGTSALTGSAPSIAGRSLALVNGVALAATHDGAFWRSWKATRTSTASALADTSTSKLWLDGRRRLSVEENLAQIGADVAHERGLLGDGVKVAVIDSGIDSTHPDLEGQVTAQKNFVADEEDDRDYVGHGTHVASVIAGTGTLSQGRYLGVAPHAQLIDAKACTLQGGCLESAILESFEWAADQGARIINVSFGASDTRGEDLIEAAVNKLSKERGVLVVAAAGNDFVFGFTVGSPASADAALAVGALSAFELPSDFSQRGRLGELTLKPELVAPGENIVAARSSAMEGGLQGGIQSGEEPADGYFTASGTSMAAPHVSGAAALLSQRHPEWQGDKLKAVLMGSAQLLDGQPALAQGAGLVNIPAALDLQVRAEPAAVSFGRPAWPHDDDTAIERKLTLHNESDRDVVLELTLEARAADGASADTDMFSLSASKLEIAAHGQAEVTLTADTRKGTDGLYSGTLIAAGSGVSLHVPFLVEREVESYDLELRFVGRDGEPSNPDNLFASVIDRASTGFPPDVMVENDSTATLRLARGTYAVTSGEYDPEGLFATQLVYPELTFDRDTTLVLDARRAKPIQIEPPLQEAELAFLAYNYNLANYGSGASVTGEGELFVGRLGPSTDLKVDGEGSSLSATWHAPGAPEDSEYQIHWARFFPNELLNGFSASPALSDFAEVDTKFARGGLLIEGNFMAMGTPADPTASYSQSALGVPVPLPGSQRIYYGLDSALTWHLELSQFDFEAGIFDSWEEVARLEAGECYEQQWNQAVFGPASGEATFGVNVQRRYGDSLQLAPALLADNQGRSGGSFGAGPGARARLFRDGELIEELSELNLFVDVPAESARYRVELELDRPAPAELSTRVELTWEFVSESTGSDEGVALPLSYIRFLPKLDQESAAAQGATIELPIRVEPQPEADVPAPESLTVEVSYDDGQTWRDVDVQGEGAEWSAQLEHPQQSGYVSLRAAAIDADDNLVEVTIIRAYRLE